MMSGAKKIVPKRRFKEFLNAGDWEQRKLNDLLTIRRGLTYKPSDIAENGIRVLRSSNIDEDQFITSNDDVFVNIEAVNIPFAKNGDILITSANGSNRLVGKHTIISDIADNSAVHGGFMLLAESNNPLFTDALLSSNWYKRFINTYVAGGNGAIGNLSKSDLESQTVMIPSEHEQAKIGQWYDNINQLITLHQRKLDKLQATKKALLQEMFPEEGQDKPKRRFKGFTDAWEQRKLGDFYTFKNGLNKEKVYFGYGDSIVNFTDVFHNRQIYSSTLKGKVFVNKKELENFRVKEGDLFFTRTSETIDEIGFPAVVMEPMERVVFSGFVLRGRAEKNDPLVNIFKSYIFFTDNFRSEMKKKSSMTTRALTSGTALKEMYFSYPKDLEEQTKIGEILLRLDNIITLHQRKLDKLKNLKQAYLNEMFV